MELSTGRVDLTIRNVEGDVVVEVDDTVVVPQSVGGYVMWQSDPNHSVTYMMVPGDSTYVTARTVESKFETGDEVQYEDEIDGYGYSYGVVSEPFWDGEVKYRVVTYTLRGYPMPRPIVFTETELTIKPEGV